MEFTIAKFYSSMVIGQKHSYPIQSVFLAAADLFLPKSIFWHDIDPHSYTMHAREAGLRKKVSIILRSNE